MFSRNTLSDRVCPHVSAIFSKSPTPIPYVCWVWIDPLDSVSLLGQTSDGRCIVSQGYSSSSQQHSWPQATTVLLTDTTARPLTQQNPTANILIQAQPDPALLHNVISGLSGRQAAGWMNDTLRYKSTWETPRRNTLFGLHMNRCLGVRSAEYL